MTASVGETAPRPPNRDPDTDDHDGPDGGHHRPTTPRGQRIDGLDLARALAMAGMVVVHYVWPDESGEVADVVASALSGRAMPLFVLLGGIGVSLAVERSSRPNRDLLIRAAILFVLGLLVAEVSEWVVVVLQVYGLFFALTPALRRLPTDALPLLAIAIAGIAGWSYQVLGTFPRTGSEIADLGSPVAFARSLIVDGYYPFFAVGSFFVLGLYLGRLDLRSARTARMLTASGLVLGIGTLVGAAALVGAFDLDPEALEASRRTANPAGYDPARFEWGRLLHLKGHGQMPAWVLSSAGTSMAVLGASLLAAPRLGRLVAPLAALGRLALTFYVFQVVLTTVVTRPTETDLTREVLTAAAIYLGFVPVAWLWLRWFPAGPLEALLRAGRLLDRGDRVRGSGPPPRGPVR